MFTFISKHRFIFSYMYTLYPATVRKVKCNKCLNRHFVHIRLQLVTLYIEEHKHLGSDSTFLSFRTLVQDKDIRLTMDPIRSAQDVLRCHICQTPMPPLYCDICRIHLCKACVGEHILDESKDHKVVLFKNRGSTHKCPKHCSRQCLLYCKQCDILICSLCSCCGEHANHKKVDIFINLEILKRTSIPQYAELLL